MKNLTSRFRAWLKNVPIQDVVDRQMALLLQFILIGLIVITVAATMINIALAPTFSWQDNVFQNMLAIIIFIVPLVLLRRGYFHGAVISIIVLIFLLLTNLILNYNLQNLTGILPFLTLIILLAGLLMGQNALIIAFMASVGLVILPVLREQDSTLRSNYIGTAGNFILLNGLISIFINAFGVTLRTALQSSLKREKELGNEINTRRQAEAALEQSQARLEILHEIDRALLSANSPAAITQDALARIRRLIPCHRASVSLFDMENNEVFFLAAELENGTAVWETTLSVQEFGQYIIDEIQQNKPFIMNDVLTDPRAVELDMELTKQGIHSWLYLPLLYQGQLIGALNLGRGLGGRFTLQDAETAKDVANQLAIAIQQNRLHDALQKELSERQNLISQLEANNAELERFTYTVSHDLRNPLVTIKGFLGMLDKDIREAQPERIQKDFQRIAGAADKMDELLSDLLELSRIGRIVNTPEEVDLVELTQEALELLDARIHVNNLTLSVSPDLPRLYGDRLRIREVLENLIANAAKYMGEQSQPRIEIGVRAEANEPVVFVKDNGIGIETRYHSRIFTLFEKLNPTMEGTGIGLALVKRIVEVHGGRIWVESDGLGKGSTFCFTIPNKTN